MWLVSIENIHIIYAFPISLHYYYMMSSFKYIILKKMTEHFSQ